MKRFIANLSALMLVNILFGQFYSPDSYTIDFDNFPQYDYIIIDTISNPDNIWQIGVPNKPMFANAYSATHAIVTDTLNPYPINDTSSFIFRHIRPTNPELGNESLQLKFWYKFNSDSLTDFGMVEASIDNGATWINLLTEDETYDFSWLAAKPILTGNSNGWQQFALELSSLTYMVGYSDTLCYRFTFISDSVQTNKDGWMIDNFEINDSWEKVDKFDSNENITLYPNPSNGNIHIEGNDFNLKDVNAKVKIYNARGVLILSRELNSNHLELDLPNGMYFVKLSNDKRTYVKKIVIKK